ncbi:MAG: primosomal protein N' [Desulfococcaceae bacterium]|jgi:primosomal protein N' (replication factor Y)|nr:primosomal protein N' [Desulfococcaceae bacterium]
MPSDTKSSVYIEVAVAFPDERTFTYAVPDTLASLVSPGKRVLVPFGRRRLTAYVLGTAENRGQFTPRCILDVLDDIPLFPPEMIPFFQWTAAYYLCPLGEVIKNALPGGMHFSDYIILKLREEGKKALRHGEALNPAEKKILENLQKGPVRQKDLPALLHQNIPSALIQHMENSAWISREKQLRGGTTRAKTERFVSLVPDRQQEGRISGSREKIYRILASEGEVPVRKLKESVPTAPALIRSMAEKGYVRIFEKEIYRDPFGEPVSPDQEPELTPEQAEAFSRIRDVMGKGFSTWLLAGVTGSGKTEVYLRLTAAALEMGLPVIVLVPEIALISQTERRFRARFGEKAAVLHSGLSAGERYDQWMRILRGEAPVTLGARSAIFAPYANPGLIIVDEEHDTSYKQGSDLLYNARDLATVRARLSGGIALLGSATPSVQSYYNVRRGKFRLLTLSRRVEKRPMPRIRIVDLRENRDVRGARRFITPELHRAMGECLERGEQVLLFLNRRGYATFPVCGACGQAVRCPHCDITLTYHRLQNAFCCHYCGFSRESTYQCPACGSPGLKYLGMGTEKVESAVRKLFPGARVARMDRDTTSRKGSVLKILKALRNSAIDVLIGTQMVAKGHDFPHITLVGIICADLSLSFPDFRAGERTFQMLAQVAGRAGRGDVPGRVILQTYVPDHFSILAARAQDFKTFYQTEIAFRRALRYPPFTRLILLRISGTDIKKTETCVQHLGTVCRKLLQEEDTFRSSIEILGPIAAAVAKIADRYRWQLLLKGRSAKSLRLFLRELKEEYPDLFRIAGVRIVADADPYFL